MTTRLSDLYNESVYRALDPVNSIEKTAIYTSGMVTRNEALDFRVQTGITTQSGVINMPYWLDLGDTEANISNDDPTKLATPESIGMDSMKARVSFLNKSFGVADLASELAGGAPMQRIRNRFGAYWQRQFERRLISTLGGVMASNIADNAGDMVVDVSGETAYQMDSDVVMEGRLTMGDAADKLTALVVHSMVYGQIHKEVENVYDEILGVYVKRYAGLTLIVDDSVPVAPANGVDSTDGYIYTSYLVGAGAVGYGVGNPTVPTEIDRVAQGGNGAGIEAIIERQTYALHPLGFSWKGSENANNSPSLAGLETAGNWERKLHRKLVPLAFLRTKN